MKKAAILLLAVGLMAGQYAFAGGKTGSDIGSDVDKAGHAAGHGIERGAKAAGRGIRKGGRAAGHGLEVAGKWIQRKFGGDKKGSKKESK